MQRTVNVKSLMLRRAQQVSTGIGRQVEGVDTGSHKETRSLLTTLVESE